ncbi:unnamed protein product, partial [marine sediment metagenome]
VKKNADFLVKNLAGKEVQGSATVNVRYKTLVGFAKVYGITDPKYVGPEEEGIIACHAFANNFTIKALYKLLLGMKLIQDGIERPFMLNVGKLLHGGQKYDWEGCVDVKPGDKLKKLYEDNTLQKIIIIPGGGSYANFIRSIDKKLVLGDDFAHWMAIFSMDYNGKDLNRI